MFSRNQFGAKSVIKKIGDDTRLLRAWAEAPLRTGAVAASGPDLADKMASYIPKDREAKVLELGPGTGPVTKAILKAGILRQNLISLEYNADFLPTLHKRYAGVNFVQGDAYNLHASLPKVARGSLSAVVSSLPLISQPMYRRLKCLHQCFALMRPGAPFIQFSYSVSSPLQRKPKGYTVETSGWVVKNLPPARVWIFRESKERNTCSEYSKNSGHIRLDTDTIL
ncbi:class I SAM-dependent methyltransferase [Polycladidibacter hongkongensis]|uniref:class I SAM-dependent methyltransferase n=1 Tax=Polycladidibacter hongkongensis TaxID=1647556 RepID=UPI000A423377|nr:methyltransferase domain-containing protein [Pseudovibrio hongkongensis]